MALGSPDDPRSPVWGGATLALSVGLIFGGVSTLLGWGDFVGNGLKAAAVVFTFMFVIGLPGVAVNVARRTPLAARVVGETFWETLISGVLIYLAFFRS